MTPLSMSVIVCRKEGRANYGSEGASCELEFEFSAEAQKSIELRDAEIAKAYKICTDAVTDQLIAAQAAANADPGFEPGETRDRVPARDERPRRETEYDDRLDDQHDYGDRRNASPPRRDDRERYRDDGGGRRQTNSDREPRTGPQLFGWAKDRDELKWFSAFGKDNRFPAKFNDWDERDVSDAMRAFHGRRSTASSNGNGRH
jgi:hypothetical protein